MTVPLVVHGFETSNNIKVRVALGYKDLPHEFHTIDPTDRETIVRLWGQFLTPVLVHADRVLFDSAAILRYLDANFPDTPRLFGTTMPEQWAIEDWELFARAVLAGPMMEVVHQRVAGGTVDEETLARCGSDFGDAVTALAAQLGDREWLVGDAMTAADVTAAAVVYRIRSSGMLPLPDVAKSLAPWVARVMAFDRGAG